MIKFLDIYKQDKKIHKLIFSDFKKIINKSDFILGRYVNIFEKKFAEYCKVKYSISCGNGTDALTIALKSLKLPNNSEVIIPAMTYCSTIFAVINANLKPVLVDTEYLRSTISLEEIKKKITKKTKVIIPVHLYGSTANIKGIKKIIKGKNIFIIDDCAQAHGAIDESSRNLQKVGSTADISCFSFYPGKNLGAYGDAGIITTNNQKLFRIIKNYRNLGSDKKFIHTQIGCNSRLDTIQAAILLRKIKYLNNNNNKRIKISKIYNKKIINKKITKLFYSKTCVYHQYIILSKERNKLVKKLIQNNIQYGFHYPKSINQIESVKSFFKNKTFKNAEVLASRGLSIPINPNLSNWEINKIIKVLNTF